MDQKTANELVRNFEETRDIEFLDIEVDQVERSEAYKITFKNILTGKEYHPAYTEESFKAKMERIKEGYIGPHSLPMAIVYLLDRIKKLEKTVKLMEESKSTCTYNITSPKIRKLEEEALKAEARLMARLELMGELFNTTKKEKDSVNTKNNVD